MNNHFVEKTYLALELTKARWNNQTPTNKDILNSYNYFLTNLTEIENLQDYSEMKAQLEETTKKYNELKEDMERAIEERIAHKQNTLKHILDDARGDMEPYVYESLIKLVK